MALTVDHVVPVTLGGGDEPNNLVTACQPCNAGKSSVPADAALVEEVDATALMFAKALERAAELRRNDFYLMEAGLDFFVTEWRDHFGHLNYLPDDYAASVQRFASMGLYGHEMSNFVRLAYSKQPYRPGDAFKFFCGCCWRELADRQELARRLIEDGQV